MPEKGLSSIAITSRQPSCRAKWNKPELSAACRQTRSRRSSQDRFGIISASADSEDAVLIRDHVVRVEVQSDRLIIELADAKGVHAKRKRGKRIEVPLAQDAIQAAPGDSGARNCGRSPSPPHPFRESRASRRLDCARTPLA